MHDRFKQRTRIGKRFKKCLPALLFLTLIFTGCSPAIASAPIPKDSASLVCETPTIPAQEVILTEVVQATEEVCIEKGLIKDYSLPSTALGTDLAVSIYFPPCYSPFDENQIPYLILLHGQEQAPVLWQELGISEKADESMLSEQGAPFLIVMPHEEFHFRSPEKNRFPEAILNELIPWLEEEFDVCEERYCRAIGGISRGGSWALRMALLEWNTFSVAGLHSAPLFNGDIESVPDWINAIPDESLPALYLDIGNIDPAIKNASELNELLNSLGIAHEWHLNQGRHDEEYWESQLNAYLNWYSIQLSKEQ